MRGYASVDLPEPGGLEAIHQHASEAMHEGPHARVPGEARSPCDRYEETTIVRGAAHGHQHATTPNAVVIPLERL